MFIHYRTQGFVLKKEDRGEADQLFTIYTKDFGKLEILGKGIRKISSKLRASIEIFYLSEIEFIQGKTYKTLTDAILIDKFRNLRKDLKRLNIAYKISETLDNLIRGQEKDEKIWLLLGEIFERLNNWKLGIKNWKIEIIYYYFFWNLISILGYQPGIYFCPFCHKKLKLENLYFSLDERGIVCGNCFKKTNFKIKIQPEVVKILRKILEKDWTVLAKLKIDKIFFQSLEKISKNYFNQILEKI